MNTEETIKQKMAAGLTKEQAEEAVANQKAHDATHPHDPPPKGKTPEGAQVPEDLNSLTVPQLKELAAQKGIEVTSDMHKADIIDALEGTPKDLEELTVPELKDLAAKKHVELTSDMNKAEIIAAIEKETAA